MAATWKEKKKKKKKKKEREREKNALSFAFQYSAEKGFPQLSSVKLWPVCLSPLL